jgi:prepilin peptidase CpaA
MIHISKLGVCLALLAPLTVIISYYDVRYRRIPNICVLITLIGGIGANAVIDGWRGVLNSLAGCVFAFCLLFTLRCIGAMGAGDVKLFASVGAVIGIKMVFPAFLIALITGGALAAVMLFCLGAVYETAQRVSFIFVSLLTDFSTPRFAPPTARKQTVPYGVAIMFGSLISLAFF